MDERKGVFQDEFTENEAKPKGPEREAVEETEQLDPDVNSQEDDETMADDDFGVDENSKS